MTRPSEVAETFVAAISRHDPDAAARCFAQDYEDEAPARRGEVVRGRDEARANFACCSTSGRRPATRSSRHGCNAVGGPVARLAGCHRICSVPRMHETKDTLPEGRGH